ncbi:MAG TPA: hypothetical protein VF070_18405 [Streptosporangiaceae bacterium]
MTTVYYSLTADADGTRERQWARSVQSLRRYNGSIPVVLCLYGGASAATFAVAVEAGVRVVSMGEYPAALGDIPPHWRAALVSNPTLHKLLSLRGLDGAGSLLYLDCDTYFFRDVAGLFARYDGRDFYAREEPLTLRSEQGRDWTYIDEDALAGLAAAEGLVTVPPYNTGVMLLGAALARTLVGLLDDFVWYAWRLLLGACLWRPDLVEDPSLASFVLGQSGTGEQRLAMPYPAASLWIVEQIATWLTLGRIPGLAHDVLRRDDVAQNGECSAEPGARLPGLILAHYFTSGEARFFAGLDGAR